MADTYLSLLVFLILFHHVSTYEGRALIPLSGGREAFA